MIAVIIFVVYTVFSLCIFGFRKGIVPCLAYPMLSVTVSPGQKYLPRLY